MSFLLSWNKIVALFFILQSHVFRKLDHYFYFSGFLPQKNLCPELLSLTSQSFVPEFWVEHRQNTLSQNTDDTIRLAVGC